MLKKWIVSAGLVTTLATGFSTLATVNAAKSTTQFTFATRLVKPKAPNWTKAQYYQHAETVLKPARQVFEQRVQALKKHPHVKRSNDKQTALLYTTYSYLSLSQSTKLTPAKLAMIKDYLIDTGTANGNFTKAAINYAFDHLSDATVAVAGYNQAHLKK